MKKYIYYKFYSTDNKMVYVDKKLKGRLGNVMFQIAHHFSNLKNDERLRCIYNKEQLGFLMQFRQIFDLDMDIKYTIKKINNVEYFQSEKCFNANLIRKIYRPKNDVNINDLTNFDNVVGIHVRRGDYILHNGIWVVQPKEWYLNAAYKFFSTKNMQYSFLVASDDINWCKENLTDLPGKVTFVERTLGSIQTMLLMSKCKHHIGSASSFSWWISWLGEKNDSVNVFPINWYNTKIMKTTVLPQEQIQCLEHVDEIIPNRWIKI